MKELGVPTQTVTPEWEVPVHAWAGLYSERV